MPPVQYRDTDIWMIVVTIQNIFFQKLVTCDVHLTLLIQWIFVTGGTLLKVSGSGFSPTAVVTINSDTCTKVTATTSEIVCLTPSVSHNFSWNSWHQSELIKMGVMQSLDFFYYEILVFKKKIIHTCFTFSSVGIHPRQCISDLDTDRNHLDCHPAVQLWYRPDSKHCYSLSHQLQCHR